MPDKDIQAVLRHANMKTTMDVYVKPMTADVRTGMMKLQRAFKKSQKKVIPLVIQKTRVKPPKAARTRVNIEEKLG
jgi:hypothetical protein